MHPLRICDICITSKTKTTCTDIEIKNMESITLVDSTTTNLETPPIDCSLVLIVRGEEFLGVSRKHDHNDIGLPGGKLEMGEDFEAAAKRECIEETSYIVKLLNYAPFDDTDKGLFCRTFLAEIVGKVAQAKDPSETGVVAFHNKQDFLDGSFGEYNEKMFKHFGY